MDSSSIDNQSKTSTLNKFKYLFYKYYPRFSIIGRVGEHLNKFLMVCVLRLSQFLSVDRLLKSASLLETGKNPTTPLFSDITKRESAFEKKRD